MWPLLTPSLLLLWLLTSTSISSCQRSVSCGAGNAYFFEVPDFSSVFERFILYCCISLSFVRNLVCPFGILISVLFPSVFITWYFLYWFLLLQITLHMNCINMYNGRQLHIKDKARFKNIRVSVSSLKFVCSCLFIFFHKIAFRSDFWPTSAIKMTFR